MEEIKAKAEQAERDAKRAIEIKDAEIKQAEQDAKKAIESKDAEITELRRRLAQR